MNNLSKLLSTIVVFGILTMFGMKIIDNNKFPDVHGLSGVIEYMAVKTAPNRQVSKGSGVFISPTEVLTAAHVLAFKTDDERFKPRVRLEDGDLYNIKKIRKSKHYDLAIAELERPYKQKVKFPKFNCDPTTQGQILNAIGSPLVLEYMDVEIRATGGSQMEFYVQVQPEIPTSDEKPQANNKLKRYKVLPPNELPKGDPNEPTPVKPQKQKVNPQGGAYFQGPALPGQSGSPVYDKNRDIRGVVILTMVDDNIRSYAGIGMYVDSPHVCRFVQGRE